MDDLDSLTVMTLTMPCVSCTAEAFSQRTPLHHQTLSREKLRCISKERNEDLRVDFIVRMAKHNLEQIEFIDKVSKDE